MRAAAVAEEVFAKNPQHPGAIHYLIHAYDDPVHAPLGLRAARVYGKVAGSASHAQHMPAHIFFAMGMWDDAIAANIRSIAVADERIERKDLGPEARNYHSLLWLEYAYLQEGRNEEAHAVLADVTKSGAQVASAMNRAIYALETGKADETLCRGDLSRSPMLQGVAVLNSCGLVAVRDRQARRTLAAPCNRSRSGSAAHRAKEARLRRRRPCLCRCTASAFHGIAAGSQDGRGHDAAVASGTLDRRRQDGRRR